MKTMALFGAGQFGAMISRLIGTGYAISCFADNGEAKWGTTLAGIPVVSPKESLLLNPDCFCLCVMDEERAGQMEAQLRELGFDGPILRPNALKTFDARVATMRLLAEQICEEKIPGDVGELGVFRGDFAMRRTSSKSACLIRKKQLSIRDISLRLLTAVRRKYLHLFPLTQICTPLRQLRCRFSGIGFPPAVYCSSMM